MIKPPPLEPVFRLVSLPLLIVALPVLTRSMRPPPSALTVVPLPIVVALEVALGSRAVSEPLRIPPTTMRWAAGVEVAGAVAVTAVAPRTVVTPWAEAGEAVPE